MADLDYQDRHLKIKALDFASPWLRTRSKGDLEMASQQKKMEGALSLESDSDLLAGIPVCEWIISNVYVSLPAIVYGLNYFSTPSDHFLVSDLEEAKQIIKHVTNRGRYPFCYQKISERATVVKCVSIFGKTINCCEKSRDMAERIYEVFRLPLVEIVMVKDEAGCRLSSLSPVKYSQLSKDETEMLQDLLDKRVRHLE
jgi:hypothetical protein